MTKKMFLQEFVSKPLPVKGGRARKYYALTGTGQAAVTHSAETRHRMMDGLDLLDPTGTAE